MNNDTLQTIEKDDVANQNAIESRRVSSPNSAEEDKACTPQPKTLASHKMIVAFFFIILGVTLFLSFQILRPFLNILIIAAAAANLCYPIYKWITRRLGGRPNLGAVITLLLLVVIAVIPITIYSSVLSREAVNLTRGFDAANIREYVHTAADRFLPEKFDLDKFIEEHFGPEGILGSKYFKDSVDRIAGAANKIIQGFITGIASAFLSFLLFFLFLFFLLRDGEALGKELMALSPLDDRDDREIFNHLSKTIRGTLIGGVLVPIVQGILAMIGFAVFGLPSPVLWGSMVILGAVIPFVGSAIIWIPATVYMALTAATWQWVGLLMFCAIVIGTADNFLKPIILKGTANFHPLFAFISVLGGLAAFGIFGFILGPIVASLFLSLIRIYKYEMLKQAAG
jgi:predicted PurR-regulated permease PerM